MKSKFSMQRYLSIFILNFLGFISANVYCRLEKKSIELSKLEANPSKLICTTRIITPAYLSYCILKFFCPKVWRKLIVRGSFLIFLDS